MTGSKPRSEISTNVRLMAARGALRGLSFAAPGTAASLAERLFLKPPARRVTQIEAGWLARGVETPIDTPAGSLRGWRWGDGPETVLLVHGWGGRGGQLGALGPRLARRGYSVLGWDMPGHGDRPHATNIIELSDVIAAVASGSAPLGGVVAHSFGTAATLVAVARHGLDPRRLVTVAPAANLDRLTSMFAAMTGFSDGVVARMRDRLSERLGFDWDAMDGAAIAPRLDCPTLVIHDRDDRRIPVEDGIALDDALAHSSLILTDGMGHTGPLSEPDTLDRVAGFFPDRGADTVRESTGLLRTA